MRPSRGHVIRLNGPGTRAQFGVRAAVTFRVDAVHDDGSWLWLSGCWLDARLREVWTRDVHINAAEVHPLN
jgi:hypothetical protein